MAANGFAIGNSAMGKKKDSVCEKEVEIRKGAAGSVGEVSGSFTVGKEVARRLRFPTGGGCGGTEMRKRRVEKLGFT
ncbi:Kruppel-like factor 8 [Corchorus olitorius]|uniref:Kruppel-like factor 8 n=1 Tax=Corchorus olitorius TaxID=93759 RepID=A0A1R3IJ75_9ROSI|nr:Kruppel-like factor 8 [Corchorus olitorius]